MCGRAGELGAFAIKIAAGELNSEQAVPSLNPYYHTITNVLSYTTIYYNIL